MRVLHAQGIIHRDLKPANVLLSGNLERDPRVKITDFGISRGPADPEDGPPSNPRASHGAEPPTVRLSRDQLPSLGATDTEHILMPPGAPHTTGSPAPQLTRTGAISGTPSYIAPELARGGAAITVAVDVFSFGVVAYRLLTGRAPHAEAPFLAYLERRSPELHSPLVVPGLPERAARLIDACLAFSPAERPGTGELIDALRDSLEKTLSDVRSAGAT
jgi:serine/threonine protein kinase